ncbi:MAG: DUF881 domain-containing protein [Bifidobacterium sp.]|nr:DUF881 domain-containing protein [Bifidobacterium sp.]
MGNNENQIPPVYPVANDPAPVKRRAVFSSSFAQIESHHAQSPDGAPQPTRRRKGSTDSLQLIDDLINRPLDQMYNDSRLVTKPDSKLVYWGTRIIVFIICIAVGFAGCQFVRLLNTDPRKQIREQLASQLTANDQHVSTLENDIVELRKQIDEQSKSIQESPIEQQVRENEAAAGLTAVEGEGIVMTITNPLAASTDESANGLPRESAGDKLRVVTDTDLQLLVDLMWQHGAEAIAINDNRLGVQTSIRTAGNSILVGTTAIESPYRIQAIGDSDALAQSMGKDALPTLYADFQQAGMNPKISKERSMRLEAATGGQGSYARRIN